MKIRNHKLKIGKYKVRLNITLKFTERGKQVMPKCEVSQIELVQPEYADLFNLQYLLEQANKQAYDLWEKYNIED